MSTDIAVLRTEKLSIGYDQDRRSVFRKISSEKRKLKNIATGLDLTLRKGEFICLIGPNGAGKSTLMRTLAGIQKPLAGEVNVLGNPIQHIKPADIARFMSVVLTERILVGNLSVYALVALGRYPYTGWLGKLLPEDEAIVEEAIDVTGVREFADRHVSDLSDGERQKVMIARALAQDTPIILLDEPTAHLDLPNRIEIIKLLRKLSREKEKAILMSTHELDLALQAADKIWLMQQRSAKPENSAEGKSIMLTGTPEDLVLSGDFEAVFRQGGFEFDRQTGSFKIHNPVHAPIGLVGNGPHAHWTKRALEREGFCVAEDDGGSGIVELVEDGEACKWIYHASGRTAPKEMNSVAELILTLRNLKSQE